MKKIRSKSNNKINTLLSEFSKGNERALSQLMTIIENNKDHASKILHRIYHRTNHAWRIGITGPPGAGKSTLVEKLAMEFVKHKKSVGIVCVDPTSPFSGGAILGDRVRMSSIFLDPKIFIRSMATRGSLGGVAKTTNEVCDLFDAFHKDIIIIETIGVGQVELDVAGIANTTIVVLVPEAGDSIQTMKAGLMEIGHIFVVNKSDREGADRMIMEIESVLEMKNSNRIPPVLKTVATEGHGMANLYNCIVEHQKYLVSSGDFNKQKREKISSEIVELVDSKIKSNLWQNKKIDTNLMLLVEKVIKGQQTPYNASEKLIKIWKNGRG